MVTDSLAMEQALQEALCWLLRISVREISKFSCRSIEDGGIITPVFSLFLLRQPASFHEGELNWCFVFSCS